MCHKFGQMFFLFQELVCKNGLVEGALVRAAHQQEGERWRDKWCVPSTCAGANPARSRVLPARACCN